MNHLERYRELAKLKSFDPSAFCGNEEVAQDVCDFVLCLALAYNDLKDLMELYVELDDNPPPGSYKKNKQWGAYFGTKTHVTRLILALLHELLNLIHKPSDRQTSQVLDDPFMKKTVKLLSKKHKEHWATIVKAAAGHSAASDLGRFLLLVRNKTVFHYDQKCLRRGFREHFLGEKREDERAFLSCGSNMLESRFYFADAAAQSYVNAKFGRDEVDRLLKLTKDFMEDVNQALMMIVLRFVQGRGCALREERCGGDG